jgi:hypothetical protein
MLHRNNCVINYTKGSKKELQQLKGKIMFDFTKTTKQFEELAKRIQEVNEFWINSTLTATKDFFNTIKTK